MRNLLKTDLKRILKDKLFLILCIIGGVFALFNPLVYKLLFSALDLEETATEMGAALNVSAKNLFFSAFIPGDNFGLILPIFLSIILCKDFSYGTVRNKIICGKTRTNIFLSTFLSCAIVMCGVILAHALVTLLFSLLFFPYQPTPFHAKDFLYLLESVALEILVYLFIAAFLAFLSVFMKNMGLTIVMYVAVAFLCALIGGILSISLMFVTNQTAYSVLEFLTKSNVFFGTVIGQGTAYAWRDLLYVILPAVIGCVGFIGLGILVFKKKDLK